MNRPIELWSEASAPLVGTPVSDFEHLMQRVELKQLDAMIEASREEAPAAAAPSPEAVADGPEALQAEPLAPTVSFDEFAKVDLRVARVVAAEEVPKSKNCCSSP